MGVFSSFGVSAVLFSFFGYFFVIFSSFCGLSSFASLC